MPNEVSPALLDFIITLAQYMLIAFAIFITGVAAVYVSMFWKGKISGSSIASRLPRSVGRL